eukprot:gene57242-biopygen84674
MCAQVLLRAWATIGMAQFPTVVSGSGRSQQNLPLPVGSPRIPATQAASSAAISEAPQCAMGWSKAGVGHAECADVCSNTSACVGYDWSPAPPHDSLASHCRVRFSTSPVVSSPMGWIPQTVGTTGNILSSTMEGDAICYRRATQVPTSLPVTSSPTALPISSPTVHPVTMLLTTYLPTSTPNSATPVTGTMFPTLPPSFTSPTNPESGPQIAPISSTTATNASNPTATTAHSWASVSPDGFVHPTAVFNSAAPIFLQDRSSAPVTLPTTVLPTLAPSLTEPPGRTFTSPSKNARGDVHPSTSTPTTSPLREVMVSIVATQLALTQALTGTADGLTSLINVSRVKARTGLFILRDFDESKLRRSASKANVDILLQRLRGVLKEGEEGSKTCARCRVSKARSSFVASSPDGVECVRQWNSRDRRCLQCLKEEHKERQQASRQALCTRKCHGKLCGGKPRPRGAFNRKLWDSDRPVCQLCHAADQTVATRAVIVAPPNQSVRRYVSGEGAARRVLEQSAVGRRSVDREVPVLH